MKSATYNAFIILDTRRAKADNTYPLKLRIIVDRASFHIPLKVSIEKKYWKESKEQIATNCKSLPNVRKENIRLTKAKMHALSVMDALEEKGELSFMSTTDVKAAIEGNTSKKIAVPMVLQFASERIEELKEAKKIGNAAVYKTMRNSLRTFFGKKDIPLQKITYKWLKKYEAWYLSRKNSKGKPNSWNGLAVNLRTLRALYNEAIKRKMVPKDSYPFTEYSIKHEKTRKRAIGRVDIQKIQEYEPITLRQERAKDYFLMSFYLMGASFIDLAFLQMSNIHQGRIEYKRRKTGKLHSIKITEPLQAILDKYIEGKEKQDYILPVIKSTEPAKQYKNLENDIRRYNKALKEIGEAIGLSSTLTSYVARHSFATIAKFKDVPVAVISQALGHSNVETTEIYLSEFDNSVLDRYNELVVRG